MIILYAKEDQGKYKKGDIIAFHSCIRSVDGKAIEPGKDAFAEQTYQYFKVTRNKTATLVIPDHQKCMQAHWNFKVDIAKKKVVAKIKPLLKLTTKATETTSPYDGYPDIPADGKSEAKIFIEKILPGGSPCNSTKDNEELYIKTERGKLSALKVKLVHGKAEFKLQSVPETVITTITVFDPNEQIEKGQIILQFA